MTVWPLSFARSAEKAGVSSSNGGHLVRSRIPVTAGANGIVLLDKAQTESVQIAADGLHQPTILADKQSGPESAS